MGQEKQEIEPRDVGDDLPIRVAGKTYTLKELEKILEIITDPLYANEEDRKRDEETKQSMLIEIEEIAKENPELKELIDMAKKIGTLRAIGIAASASWSLEEPEYPYHTKPKDAKEQLSKALEFIQRVGPDLEAWKIAGPLYRDNFIEFDPELLMDYPKRAEEEIDNEEAKKIFLEIHKLQYSRFENSIGNLLIKRAYKAAKEGNLRDLRLLKKAFSFATKLVEADDIRDEKQIEAYKRRGTRLRIEKTGRWKKYRWGVS